jgi:UDP-glucose:(heptosyl)LPS alpha-1,3-glucosyltransferase
MNVALVVLRWFPHGGLQRDLAALAAALRERGHTVRLFCHDCEGPPPPGVGVHVLPAPGRSNHARAAAFAQSLAATLARAPHDLVVGFDRLPGLDVYFAGDRSYVDRVQRERSFLHRLTPRYRTFAAFERAVFAPSVKTHVLALDEGQRDTYRRVHGSPAERFSVLPPGIARDRAAGPDASVLRARGRAAFGIGDDERLLLFLATNARLKGLDRALRTLAALTASQHDAIRLVAVGPGERRGLRRLALRLGVAGQFVLTPPRDDVPTLLQAADLLVHPARADNTGTVLLEALAAGLPVVTTAACGYAARITASGAGRVVPEPFAQDTFDRAVAHLLTEDPATLRDRALTYAAQNDLHGMHVRAVEILEDLAQRLG